MSAEESPFIVGIGASAGGIEAFESFFRNMPDNSGMAFVIIAHLAPHRTSLLAEILGRFTPMAVGDVEDGTSPRPAHVYVIPPDFVVTIEKGRLRLREPSESRRSPNPIDVFFASLAQDQGERAIGIVLSGAGSDGTLGIKAIKEAGGLTMAQGTGETGPRHQSMPASAIATGLVDVVAPVERLAEKLVAYIQSFGSPLLPAESAPERPSELRLRSARRQICAILKDRVGHDFSSYKEKTFLRRVQRRMQVVQLTDLNAYVERLKQDPEEVTQLFRDLLIGVTSYFRDTEAFEALTRLVVPKLLEGKGAADTVRVWVPGCSTGEEVYSVAILLRERLEQLEIPVKIQIFGTDIDEGALAVARAGRYPATLLEGVSQERLHRHFMDDAGTWVVAKPVRDMCIFSLHSVIRDPPFSKIDLICCRNLLIYLNADLQAQVIPVFHYALRPSGFLFLGISENVTQHADLFVPIDKKHRIFQRLDRAPSQVQFSMLLPGPRFMANLGETRQEHATAGANLRRLIEARVLERFSPAHVVVNRDGDVVYYSPRTGKYLEPPPGLPSRQLLALARKGLRLDLRNAFQEAVETRRSVAREGIAVEIDDRVQITDLTVEPLNEQEPDGMYLVLFCDRGPPLSPEEVAARSRPRDGDATTAELERELRDTREQLQATIEEYETALEELKAANEELVSMNEELQSTNEELETSKEEIQSVNEELQTVNQELGMKVEQLNQINADLKNLFESTQIAVIFLDRHLLIRTFTPAVTSIVSLIPTDRGRPLTDITTNLDYEGFAEDVRAVIADGQPLERRVTKRDRSVHWLVRVLPYRSGEGEIAGALVTFVDVTLPVRAEEHQRTLVEELNHRVRNMLTVVSAIANQTLARAPSPEEFAKSFMGRLHALARTYGLLSRERWNDVALAEVIRAELEPYLGDRPERIALAGPEDVHLRPKAALALGMVVHELATNAVKHGALSAPEGRVTVRWRVGQQDGQGRLVVRWQEADGPKVEPAQTRGFGSELIERELRYELSGEVEVEHRPEGIDVTLSMPIGAGLVVGGADAKGARPG